LRSRAACAGLALIGGAWALLILPVVAAEWGPSWVTALSGLEPWRSMRMSVDEPYIVFGALAGLSFLAIGLALLPDLRRAHWGGHVLAWSVLAGAVVSPLSYLGTPEDSALHPLWGAEGPLLVVVGIAGALAAISADRRWPSWTRILMGATLPVLVVGTLALGYYPHGPLVMLALEAAALVLGAPRSLARQAAPRGAVAV
jgi:hypothetical protein